MPGRIIHEVERFTVPPHESETEPVSVPHVVSLHRWYFPAKTAVEFLAAAVLLVLLTPVILVAALLVKATSRGPAFYSQTRLGRHGKRFRLYKLRTMVQDAEAATGPVWTAKNDPRITPFGKWLRDTHIDEFPQLANVLLGHMSLVGPRPERPEFVSKLEWTFSNYRDRLAVRPGITGLAQVRLPPDSDLESVRQKLIHDLYYVRYANPWLDARIMVVTAWQLLAMTVKSCWSRLVLPRRSEIVRHVQELVGEKSDLLPGE